MTREMTRREVRDANLTIFGEFGLPPTAGWIVCEAGSPAVAAVQRWYDDYPEGDSDPARMDELRRIGGEYVIEAEDETMQTNKTVQYQVREISRFSVHNERDNVHGPFATREEAEQFAAEFIAHGAVRERVRVEERQDTQK